MNPKKYRWLAFIFCLSLVFGSFGAYSYAIEPLNQSVLEQTSDFNGGSQQKEGDVAANNPPVAVADEVITTIDTPVIVDVLSNDTDLDEDPLTIINVSSIVNGSVEINDDGTCLFTPDAGFIGEASFEYTISDSKDGISMALVLITVNPAEAGNGDAEGDLGNKEDPVINNPPIAVADEVITTMDTPVIVDVLTNDIDQDGDFLSIVAVSSIVNGSVEINDDGTCLFTPDEGYIGEASFEYTISDSREGTSTATVVITVKPINLAEQSTDAAMMLAGDMSLFAVTLDPLEFTADKELYTLVANSSNDKNRAVFAWEDSTSKNLYIAIATQTNKPAKTFIYSSPYGTTTVTESAIVAQGTVESAPTSSGSALYIYTQGGTGPTEGPFYVTSYIPYGNESYYWIIVDMGQQELSSSFNLEIKTGAGGFDVTGPNKALYIKGSLTVSKIAYDTGGGVLSPAQTFNITVNGPDGYTTTMAILSGDSKILTGLNDGQYSVTESAIEYPEYSIQVSAPVTLSSTTKNASLTVTNTKTAVPSLSIEKSADVASFDAVGDVITYTIEVENTGNVTITDPVVIDSNYTLPAPTGDNGDGYLQPGEIWTYTVTYGAVQADLDAGSIVNTATASSIIWSLSKSDSVTVDANQSANLSIEKSADVSSFDAVGDVITYTIEVENTGNVTITDPVVIDSNYTLPAPTGDNGDGYLQPGEIWTYTVTYGAVQADLDAGSIVNTATASSIIWSLSKSDSVTVDANQSANLSIEKSADVASFDAVGDVITYTIEVENTGNVTITDPVVIDSNYTLPAPTGDNGDGYLQPGEIWTYTVTYGAVQADLDAGSIVNTATASSIIWSLSKSDSVTVDANQSADLSIEKSADVASFDAVGDVITYTIEVENTGNVTITDPVVIDSNYTLPAPTGDNGDGYLQPGENWTYTVTYGAVQADLDAGSIVNTATASSIIWSLSKSDSVTVDANQSADPSIEKSADVASFDAVGDVITYTIEVENTGNVTITDPVVIDSNYTLPAPTGDNGDGYLQPGEIWTYTVTYGAVQADLDAGSIVNTATASSIIWSLSKSDSVTVDANQSADLSIEKSADVASFDAVGDVITYTIEVENTGNVTITDPVVIDSNYTLPAPTGDNGDGYLQPGEIWTYTVTYGAVQADLDAGSIVNTATASSIIWSLSKSDSVTVDANQSANLSIEKSADVSSFDAVGDVITYTIEVENTGNVTITDPVVIDSNYTLPAPTGDNGDGYLQPGEIWTYTVTYGAVQADLDAGSIVNTATASSIIWSLSKSDSVTVDANQSADLSIEKSADVASFDAVGDVITYTIEVENTGNVTITDPVVIDSNYTLPAPTGDNGDGYLQPGEIWTYTVTYGAVQADLDAGSIVNTATASSIIWSLSKSDSVTVDANQSANLSIEKSADVSSFDAVGDVITYTIEVENTGNVTITDPVVIDSNYTLPAPTGDNGDGYLQPGEIWTYTVTYGAVQADLDAGSIVNTATASSIIWSLSKSDSVTVDAEQKPGISIQKIGTFQDEDGNGYARVGETIKYNFIITNTGNVTLYYVTVTDPGVTVTGGPIDTLAPGATSGAFTATYTITNADLDAKSHTNIATVTAYDPNEGVISSTGTSIVTLTKKPGGGGGGGGTVTIPEEEVPAGLIPDHIAYIQGYPENVVRPEGNVTREEVAAVFFRLLEPTYKETIRTATSDFWDVETNRWSTKHIGTLVTGNIIEGYPDKSFRPGNPITRAELATIASRFDNLEPAMDDLFTDTKGHWAEKYINSAQAKGWVNGYPDGTFKPDQYITRAEFVTLVNNVLQRRVHTEDILPEARQFPDLVKGKWYYEAMQEAINSHIYERMEDTYEKWTEIYWPIIEM